MELLGTIKEKLFTMYLIDGICTRIQNLSYPQISEVLKAALIFLQFRQFCIKKT